MNVELSLWLLIWVLSVLVEVGGGDQGPTRIVSTKYGKVEGFVRHHAGGHDLPPVEVFLGVPYALPPTGDGRFTPTSSPLPWEHVLRCTKLPPVCPQSLAELDETDMAPARAAQIDAIRPLLRHQSEDCLYLNIYSPHDGGGRYPVMVYIHGESFSWGSGNLYDGSILAAYGQVTVVTVNYRLGPLGFLNTSPSGGSRGVVSNQGLMDQVAALTWVNENIASFGGNPESVTIFGHSSGAACIHYLIVSPVVVSGLFHRAILMSGSALSPWAEVQDALSVTARLAKELNCSLPNDLSNRHPETMACLRNVSAQQLVSVRLPEYKFTSLFAPSVDGVVVPPDFKSRLSTVLDGRELDVVFGVAAGDGYLELNRQQVLEGLDVPERNRLLRTYVRNNYHHHLQEIYLAITKEYTDWSNPSQHPVQVRDLTVEALSDGGFLAPLAQFGETISERADTFMYVFDHHEKDRQRMGSFFGSEVPLIFGSPFMDKAGNWSENFSRQDALVSETLMRYWSNFAKTGDPNLPEEVKPSLSFKDKSRKRNMTWEPYDSVYEKFLEISFRPRQKDHYRAHKVALWNWLIPELEEAGAKYTEEDSEAWHSSEDPEHFIGPVRPLDPFRFLHTTKMSPTSPPPALPTPSDEYLPPNVSAAQGSVTRHVNGSTDNGPVGQFLDYTTALTLTVAIGLSLLVLNAILFAALIYRRDRNSLGPKMKYDSASAQPLCTVDSGLRSTSTHEAMSSPAKEVKSTCSIDLQCTELHTFPTPPDIGDRNTEVTFHTSNSMHSILTQPTSQFIPPPPLLATTPPTPPVGSQLPEGNEPGACGGSRCYSSEGGNGQYPDVSAGQYPPDVGQYPDPYPDISLDQYRAQNNAPCVESSMPVYPASTTACPYPSQHPQYCGQYPASVSQYSSSTDQYSMSGSQFSSPGAPCSASSCQYSGSTAQLPTQAPSYPDDGGPEVVPSRASRSATLQRGSSITRKPQPPPRGSTLPSYATLPRQSSKESLSHITA
ncbi:neuroligin-1-like [Macrobrachium nipponense]|uniref:neuroligin-1-like n=1 Tax=Macrobrachium nipponense TaxID=159736 RepID=UPI0030C8CF2E